MWSRAGSAAVSEPSLTYRSCSYALRPLEGNARVAITYPEAFGPSELWARLAAHGQTSFVCRSAVVGGPRSLCPPPPAPRLPPHQPLRMYVPKRESEDYRADDLYAGIILLIENKSGFFHAPVLLILCIGC